MIRGKAAITLATFLSLGLLGLLFPSIGASLPAMQASFGIDIGRVALVSVVVQFGYALFCFFGGILADMMSKRTILLLGTALYGGCALLLGSFPGLRPNLVLFSLIGIGCGLIFISSNILVVQLYPDRRGKFLNIHHLFFALASILGPILTSTFLSAGQPWQNVYHILGAAALGIGAFFVFVRLEDTPIPFRVEAVAGKLRQYREMLRDRYFLSLLAVGLFSVGAQFGIIYLSVTFLIQARGFSLPIASLVLSVYFVLLAIGRLICSALVSRYSITRVVMLLLALLTGSLLVSWMTSGTVSAVLLALTGLACSGLMPSLLALTSIVLPLSVSGSALGLFAMFGGLGGMMITWLTTWIAGYFGFNTAFTLIIWISAATFVFFLFMSPAYLMREQQHSRNA